MVKDDVWHGASQNLWVCIAALARTVRLRDRTGSAGSAGTLRPQLQRRPKQPSGFGNSSEVRQFTEPAVSGAGPTCLDLYWRDRTFQSLHLPMSRPPHRNKDCQTVAPRELRLRVYAADVIAMGPGKADLLEAIDRNGSISALAVSWAFPTSAAGIWWRQ